eukprot:2028433-Alexandrium_andersonii.AAC.1
MLDADVGATEAGPAVGRTAVGGSLPSFPVAAGEAGGAGACAAPPSGTVGTDAGSTGGTALGAGGAVAAPCAADSPRRLSPLRGPRLPVGRS